MWLPIVLSLYIYRIIQPRLNPFNKELIPSAKIQDGHQYEIQDGHDMKFKMAADTNSRWPPMLLGNKETTPL